jgi:hypothetical protein
VKYGIIPLLDAHFASRTYVFQEDNASSHISAGQLFESHMKMLKWLAQSLDLFPIEQI